MKRFLRFFLGAAAAACLCVSALAAASADLVRTFVYDGTLYTYVVLSGVTEPITKAEATVGGQVFPASDSLKTVRQAGSPVVEMLLVDCSNSMPDFASDVTAFTQTLAQASGENTRFLLATFGKEFTVLSEDLSGAELTDAAGSISYIATQTRLNTSLDQALDYFAALPRSGNELRSIIVLSDAVQYDPQGGVSQESLAARLEESDVLLHAVGFGSDTEALARLSGLVDASRGIHLEVGPDLTAGEAAEQLASYTGDLLVTGFQLGADSSDGGTQPVTVTFGSGSQLVCRGTSEVELPASDSSETGADTSPDPALPPAEAADTPAPTASEPEEPSEPFQFSPTVVIVIGVAVIAAAVAAAALLRRKNAPAPASPQPPQPEESGSSGIYLRLEVLEGSLSSQATTFDLTGELILGRDSACDICFDCPSLSRRHARIFWTGSAVCVEDLGSQNGTFVNNTPVDAPQVLRSGAEIRAGDVAFRLKF